MKKLLPFLLPFLLLLSCQDNAPKPATEHVLKQQIQGTWIRGGYIKWRFYNNRVEPALLEMQFMENLVQEYRFTGDSVAISFSDGTTGTFAYKLSTKGAKHYISVRDGLTKDSESGFEVRSTESSVMDWEAVYKYEKTYKISGYDYRTDSSAVSMRWQRVE